jgi:hypothetical protein
MEEEASSHAEEREGDDRPICEACKEEPEQGDLDPCEGDNCNLLVCKECKSGQGCKTCDTLADMVGDLLDDLEDD